MIDRRSAPINDHVAAAHLDDAPDNLKKVQGVAHRVTQPVVDLLTDPAGDRARQLLFGDRVTVYDQMSNHSFVQSGKDSYVGYLKTAALGPDRPATHWISAPSTHVYAEADLKSPDRLALSFGSQVCVTGEKNGFAGTPHGFIPAQHVSPVGDWLSDPVAAAAEFLGTPYLWGGNTRFGIDCSGLVQAALMGCGVPCPGDSDQQAEQVGRQLAEGTAPQRGDLLFWKGHVALVADPQTILHANGFHMAVRYDPMKAAIDRIAAQGDGPVIAHRRLEGF